MKIRILALILCVVSLFALVSCGKNGGNAQPGSDGATGSNVSSGTGESSGTTGSTEKVQGFDKNAEHLFLATDIRNHSIVVFDLNACDGDYELLKNDSVAVVWEWNSDDDPTCKIKPGVGIDAAKFRYSPYYEKDVIIACSSSGWAGVIDYEEKKVLWEYKIGGGPHSIEMMPNSGDIVVACSGGVDEGKVSYVPLSAGVTSPSCEIDAPSGHGVMWDPQNECLWVLEYSQVFALSVTGEGTANAKIQRVSGTGASFEGKDASGHAFSPVYGEPGKYWVTGGHLWQFDSQKETLTRTFNRATTLDANGIKGIASFPDGTVVQTVPGSGGQTAYDWSCGELRIITMEMSSGKVSQLKPVEVNIFFEDREFYKVHPFTKEYQ